MNARDTVALAARRVSETLGVPIPDDGEIEREIERLQEILEDPETIKHISGELAFDAKRHLEREVSARLSSHFIKTLERWDLFNKSGRPSVPDR